MNPHQQHTVLVIDDEEFILTSLNRLLRREFNVLVAQTAQQGLNLMRVNEVHVVLSDQRMPEMTGVDFLSKIKGVYPDAIRMLLTGYADLESVIAAINSGNIYRYMVKPWDPNEIIAIVREACQKYDLIIKNRELTTALMSTNAELEQRVQGRTAQLTRANTFITTLGHIAARLQSDLQIDQLLNSLNSELETLKMSCLVTMCTTNQLTKLLPSEWINEQLNWAMPKGDCNLPLTEIPQFQAIGEQHQAEFIPDLSTWYDNLCKNHSDKLPSTFLRLAEIRTPSSGAVIPLHTRQELMAVMVLWGVDFREEDLTPLSIFTSQVAVALENARLFEAVQHLASLDGLTGLSNRRHITEITEREFGRSKRLHRDLTVIMIDIDHFKLINDNFGHVAGDHVLQQVARFFQQSLRKDVDSVGRYGGDEFIVLLPESNLENATAIANRLQEIIEHEPIQIGSSSIRVSVSLGISSLTDEISSPTQLLDLADQAMYLEKRKKKTGKAS